MTYLPSFPWNSTFISEWNELIMHAPDLERACDLASTVRTSQTDSKLTLVNQLTNSPRKIVLLGGWYGNVMIHLLRSRFSTIDRITIVDVDEALKPWVDYFCNRMGWNNVDYRNADVFHYIQTEQFPSYDTIINTSCEHMLLDPTDIIKKCRPGAHVGFQTTNKPAADHHNLSKSVGEFLDKMEGIDPHSVCSIRINDGYQRFSVVGTVQ